MSDANNERFLSRWSRLKRESKALAEPAPATLATTPSPEMTGAVTTSSARSTCSVTPMSTAEEIAALPPVESLTMQSDYAPFFQPRIPEDMRRAALKKLFADPHFNVMDGLDTYIDDYSKPDPLPEGWLEKMSHARDLLDHPSVRKRVEEAAASEEQQALMGTESPDTTPVGWVERSDTHQPGDSAGASTTVSDAVAQADTAAPSHSS